jgi:hypothetical protein
MKPSNRRLGTQAGGLLSGCLAALSTLLSVVACTGTIGDGGDAAGGGSTPGTVGGGAGNPTLCGSSAQLAAAPIRRLNRFEYDNTVRDLLSDASGPAREFPAEERQSGFNNNGAALTVSPLLAESYLSAAERLAAEAVEKNMAVLTPSPACDLGQDDAACVQSFIQQFGERAYRGPLAADEVSVLQDVYAAGKTSGGHKNGLKLAITTMLISPRYLYRVEFGVPAATGETVVRLDSWEMASRLSYLLWGTMPDAPLMAAARAGQLLTDDQIAAQVGRMMMDSTRTRVMARNFHEQWLQLYELPGREKDTTVYPSWNAELLPLMAEETQRFVDYVVFEGEGTLQELFTAPYTFVNGALAKHYDPASTITSATFDKVPLDGAKRGGLLTHGSLMTLLANADQSNPVRRGKFVREQILCQHLPPPPEDAKIDLPTLDPALTTRERFSEHRENAACAGCHTMLDPVGLGLENFDAVGRWRDTENGKVIDASGEVSGMADGKFNGALDLARKLSTSEEVASCVVDKWFTYGYGREPVATEDGCSVDSLKRELASSGNKIRDLIVALTKTPAFRYRRAGGAQ